MPGPKTVIFWLMALTGGVFLFTRIKRSAAMRSDEQKDDELIDTMSEQSFPASDPPAY